MRDFDPPIIVNCRDRVTPLRKLVAWLELAGHERIFLLDNASTYEPLREYLRLSSHAVVHLEGNFGSRALWNATTPAGRESIIVRELRRDWFVYTDPDIVPIDECPLDAVELLHHALLENPQHRKAALGLYLDDVPDNMRSLDWEIRLLHPQPGDAWKGHIGFVGDTPIFDSLADTTFALYRPHSSFVLESLRTGWPYQARHCCHSWYGGQTNEERYYADHAMGGPEGSSGCAL